MLEIFFSSSMPETNKPAVDTIISVFYCLFVLGSGYISNWPMGQSFITGVWHCISWPIRYQSSTRLCQLITWTEWLTLVIQSVAGRGQTHRSNVEVRGVKYRSQVAACEQAVPRGPSGVCWCWKRKGMQDWWKYCLNNSNWLYWPNQWPVSVTSTMSAKIKIWIIFYHTATSAHTQLQCSGLESICTIHAGSSWLHFILLVNSFN